MPTYTTNFRTVSDRDSETYNPQNLVQKDTLIGLTETEVQWKGTSETTYKTVSDTTSRSDSATASTQTVENSLTNESSRTTTGDQEKKTKTITRTNTSSGQYGRSSGSVSVSPPSLPDEATVTQIEADYYIDENTGGNDYGISVSFDDDPYNINNYDTTKTNININDYSKKRVGGFDYNNLSLSKNGYERAIDGAQIRFENVGEKFGTSGLVAEITVTAEVTSIEETLDRKDVETIYPSVPSGHTFDRHQIIEIEYDNSGNITNQESQTINSNKVGNTVTKKSPDTKGYELRVIIKTFGTKRNTIPATASVDYPSPPTGYSFENHKIIKKYSDSNRKENSASGQYGNQSGSISVSPPTIPSGSTIQQINADYYVDENSGGVDTGITVSFDDEPYDLVDYDTTVKNISVDAGERARVGGFNENVSMDVGTYEDKVDGAQIRFEETGNNFGTAGLVAEITVIYSNVTEETIYEERSGEAETITSTTAGKTVSITIKTNSIKTTSNTEITENASIDYDFIGNQIDTSAVAILVDTSTSINLSRLQNLVIELVEQLPKDGLVSLVDFDFDTDEVVGLDTVETNNDKISNEILNLNKEGGTDIELGLNVAHESLNGNDGSIFLLSDGLSSTSDPTDIATSITSDGTDIVSVGVGTNRNDELLQSLADISGSPFFQNKLSETISGVSLQEDELSEWIAIDGFTRGKQTINHRILGVGQADFRLRFTWEYLTPDPRVGTVAFYDSSNNAWKEVAVADPQAPLLEYNHVSVYNNSISEWGALDVVDPSNEAAITSHQFYDEDAGWLSPRQFNTV